MTKQYLALLLFTGGIQKHQWAKMRPKTTQLNSQIQVHTFRLRLHFPIEFSHKLLCLKNNSEYLLCLSVKKSMVELDKVVCFHSLFLSPLQWLSCWLLPELKRLETG